MQATCPVEWPPSVVDGLKIITKNWAMCHVLFAIAQVFHESVSFQVYYEV